MSRKENLHGCASIVILLLVLCGVWSRIQSEEQPTVPGPMAANLHEIQNRYVLSVLPTNPDQISRLRAMSAQYAANLESDGNWTDIPYGNSEEATWKTAEHLKRTLVMAKSSRLSHEQGKADARLDGIVIRALQAWTDKDYKNPNWWWNEIGVPELVGEIATLMQPELSKPDVAKVVEIMARSDWHREPTTGANRIWRVENEVVRGCLSGDVESVKEAYGLMYAEIKVVAQPEEGIETDDSFHQHGVQLYNGGYGLAYADDVGRFIAFAWGTPFQVPPAPFETYCAYILDGLQWMVQGNVIDHSVEGREITREGKTIAPIDWTVGPISPAGPAYSLENVLDLLAATPTPRQREFQNFAARLHGQMDAPSFTGNKQFWNSDFMAHRRKGFYTSVKMLSNRMRNGELINGEGTKSHHLSDGVNFLYMTGDEYKDIFPVWDWTKLPGATAIQGTLDTGDSNPIELRGKTSFDGGVSDGLYGMAAMDLSRGNLRASKAWFFFDNSYLCLGAGITLAGDTNHRVATDVNQTLLNGPVTTNRAKDPLQDGTYNYASRGTTWIFHNKVGYIFPRLNHVALSIGPQSGKWSEIGSGSNRLVTTRVFNVWIDHGVSPKEGTYDYVVLPGATVGQTITYVRKPAIQVLANDEKIQAAWNAQLHLGMMAFREAGSLATPAGNITVDHSCLLMVSQDEKGWKITAANPENLPLTLHVKLGYRLVSVKLPGGNLAGSSATVHS